MNKYILPRVPDGFRVFKEGSNICFISRFFIFFYYIYTCMCLNNSLNKSQGVISFHCELVDSLVHDKSSEIFTPRYLAFLVDWTVNRCSL